MMTSKRWAIAITTILCAATARAQFVAGNEAVDLSSSGTKRVDLPQPKGGFGKPCAASAGCHTGPWHMVETRDGLRECTEPYARATTCRDSSYGTKKLSRLWIVKRGTSWL